MKRLLFFLALIIPFFSLSAKNEIFGVLRIQGGNSAASGVVVSVEGDAGSVTSDADGSFRIVTEQTGRVVISFSGSEVMPMQQVVDVSSQDVDLGEIYLIADMSSPAYDDMILTISEAELDNDGSGQSISGLLSSRGDVFSSKVGFQFSSMRFRTRGLDGQYNNTYINGIRMNDAERGFFTYSQVGGLNDMLRTKETVNSTESASFSFGNIGGSQNINARASAIRKGFKVSQVASNRTYTSRTMVTYATGLMNNGWAFAASASYRYAKSGYVQGTFYDAWAFALAAEKRFDTSHSLSLTVMGAPTNRGQQAGATQEAYDLTPRQTFFRTQSSDFGNNFYNPNWGYQNGVMRNAKQVKSFTPIAILSHEWRINESSKLTTSVGYKYQMDGRTALNWYKAADPRPDYYRNLPTYYRTLDGGVSYDEDADAFVIKPSEENMEQARANEELAQLREELWRNNESYRQVNWDNMYQINYLSRERGSSARYIVENRRNDQQVVSATSVLNYKFSDAWRLDAGVELQSTSAYHYKLIDDLLGADYWLDIDQYGERDNPGNPNFMQNDLDNPDRKVKKGDRFGYNYNIYANNVRLWAVATYSNNFLDVYFGGQGEYSNFWRDGKMLNGRSSEDLLMASTLNGVIYSESWIKTVHGSKGRGSTQNFLTYAAKAGLNYRITGRHILTLNAQYGLNAPNANTAYFAQRIKPNLIPDLSPEKVMTVDLSYFFRTPVVNGRVTVYNTNFWDSKELKSFYNDEYNTMVNFATYGFNKRHTGAEFGIEVDCGAGFKVSALAAAGQYVYTSDQRATVSYENGLEDDIEFSEKSGNGLIHTKGFHMSGTPEIAASVGLHYFHPSYWFVDLNINGFANAYLDFNPLRRTDAAVAGLFSVDEGGEMVFESKKDLRLYRDITEQERLSNNVPITVDLSVGKSIRINYKYFLNINLSATNILNNVGLKTGGFEQSRFSTMNAKADRATYLARFPAKYFYANGATIFLNVGFRF